MFQAMRRQDRGMDQKETEQVLQKGKYGVLSMNGVDDHAYGVPMSYIYTGNSIYLHCALEGQKLTHIRNNDKVSFCVVGEADPLPNDFSMKYASVIAFGKVGEVDDEGEKRKALVALIEKYASNHDYIERGRIYAANSIHTTVVLRIDVDHLTGKARR